MTSATPLCLHGATKCFGNFRAVDALDFTVSEGEILGFLGPNGAGKSTSLRMSLGILVPDKGTVHLFGETPNLGNLRRVGFLPEERGLYKKMSPRQIITYFACLKGMSRRDARTRADELLDMMDLSAFAKSRMTRLSKGMAQKVQILVALAHRPRVLILDEPFSGLDPVSQQALETLIATEHRNGATVVFSTHVMEHAERLCRKIVMMARGKKVFDGTLDEALTTLARTVRMDVESGFDLATALKPAGFSVTRQNSQWLIALSGTQNPQQVLRAAIDAGAPITGFSPEEVRLRDVFVSLVGEAGERDLRDSENANSLQARKIA